MDTTKPINPAAERFQFYSERVYARSSVTIPQRLRGHRGAVKSWTISDVIGEIVRDPEHCPHVDNVMAPIPIYGYGPERLHEYADALAQLEERHVETYTRRGKTHTRAVKTTTPTLLAAVASYPKPSMEDSPERRRWTGLVVDACRERWGKRLRSVIMHTDEAFAHLHILIDNVGESVKPLHMGHQLARLEEDKAKKGEAYREGGSLAQDWFFEKVGRPMGWKRNKPAGLQMPRAPRPVALRKRQAELEELARELEEERAALVKARAALVEQDRQLTRSWNELEAVARRVAVGFDGYEDDPEGPSVFD